MQFLTAEESHEMEKRIWRQLGDPDGRPASARSTVYYECGTRARAIVEAVMPFTQATLLSSATPFGDGWDKRDAEYPVWRDFYNWRNARGENERLYTMPGHVLAGDESEDLIKLLTFALTLGWDALLAARPGRNVLSLSHDDRIEFHAGFKHRSLAAKLTNVGSR
jgi:hypothetical protein